MEETNRSPIIFGEIYTPVAYKYGLGYVPLPGDVHDSEQTVTCCYPWQTPIGVVVSSDPEHISTHRRIATHGMFTIPRRKIITPNNDTYEGGQLLGMRVYFERAYGTEHINDGYYVCEFASTVVPDNAYSFGYHGLYPGSGTVGYIVNVRVSPYGHSQDQITIKIDPKPPKSKYIAAKWHSDETLPEVGISVWCNERSNVAQPWVQSNPKCSGVASGVMMVGSTTNVMVIICVSGPAWVCGKPTQLFASPQTPEALTAAGCTSTQIPISASFTVQALPTFAIPLPVLCYSQLWSGWDECNSWISNDHPMLMLAEINPQQLNLLTE